MKRKILKSVSALLIVSLLFGCGDSESLTLREDTIYLQYGEIVSISPKEVVDTDDEEFLEKVTIDTSSIKNEDGKSYPAIGKYEVIVSYNDGKQEAKLKVEVVDTKKQDVSTNSDEQDTNANSGNSELTYYDGILVVNKKHPLPAGYAPGEDSVAADAVHQLIDDMQLQGYDVQDYYSGYRSYETQESLYNGYVADHGKAEADTFSARPGYSEHQTGLAFDLLHNDGSLVEKAEEANWIADNAHLYGFIVRYKAGKESITGYQAEPWHLRYIGDEATDIYNSGLTLEEYLGAPSGDYE